MGSKAPSKESHTYEFGGPIGAIGISVGLPVFAYFLLFACNDKSGCPTPLLLHPSSLTLRGLADEVGLEGWHTLFDLNALLATLSYYLFSLILYGLLPAREVHGTELKNGGRVKYRFNTLSTCIVTLAMLFIGTALYGANFFVWTYITDHYYQIVMSNIIIAAALATFTYARSFTLRPENRAAHGIRELAHGGTSGNMLYDWFIGRELNPSIYLPTIGEVDIKPFMELRPGIVGWLLLDLTFAAKQYRTYGHIADSMLLVVAVQGLYVLDSLWYEPLMLTQIDITTDGFGFMLAFGDLVWAPFTYSIQARYLSVHPVEIGLVGDIAIVLTALAGYYIFRASNSEKDTFRTKPDHPSVKSLPFIRTSNGGRLLVGGWWGTARHVNYFGDWLMSCAYCLPTGIAGYVIKNYSSKSITAAQSVTSGEARGWGMLITYFYLLYFAVLLIHRQRRDDVKGLRKYGKDWTEYERRVPSRIIPGIY